MIANPFINLKARVLNSRLGRQFTGTFAIRFTNTGLKSVTALVLARLLGTGPFGTYNFAMAWITMLTVLAIAGFDQLVIRNLAVHRTKSDWGRMNGLLRFSRSFTIWFAVGLAVAGAWIAWVTYKITGRPALLRAEQADLAKAALYTLLIALALLPIRVELLLQQAAMQGLRRIVTAQIPEQVFQLVLYGVLIGGLFAVGRGAKSAQWAMTLQLVSYAVALAYSTALLARTVPRLVSETTPVIEARAWLSGALPF
ncbi:MAG TPA: oligosaccharide flippase family protein, partial [Aggregatilineaceae bacterium]|nr:oligosaccharide flippase family protein [Aggregatilineaceae bacterium]